MISYNSLKLDPASLRLEMEAVSRDLVARQVMMMMMVMVMRMMMMLMMMMMTMMMMMMVVASGLPRVHTLSECGYDADKR